MKVKVNGEVLELPWTKASVKQLISFMGWSRGEVLACVNGEVTVEDEELKEGDDVKLIPVFSGG